MNQTNGGQVNAAKAVALDKPQYDLNKASEKINVRTNVDKH